MANAIVLWLHIVAAAIFVGPQVFLVVAAVPAVRSMEDAAERARVMRIVTTRFGWLGGGALAVLVVTGILNYIHERNEGLIDSDAFPRYFVALQIKLTLVAVVILLTALHGAVLGRRMLRLQESGAAEAEIAAVRRWSVLASAAILIASIAILLCAALLGSDWSKG